MKWSKQGSIQKVEANGFMVEIMRSGGRYWATCYYNSCGAKIKKFTFPPSRSIKVLKRLVESNSLLEETTIVEQLKIKEPKEPARSSYEYDREPYWVK